MPEPANSPMRGEMEWLPFKIAPRDETVIEATRYTSHNTRFNRTKKFGNPARFKWSKLHRRWMQYVADEWHIAFFSPTHWRHATDNEGVVL